MIPFLKKYFFIALLGIALILPNHTMPTLTSVFIAGALEGALCYLVEEELLSETEWYKKHALSSGLIAAPLKAVLFLPNIRFMQKDPLCFIGLIAHYQCASWVTYLWLKKHYADKKCKQDLGIQQYSTQQIPYNH